MYIDVFWLWFMWSFWYTTWIKFMLRLLWYGIPLLSQTYLCCDMVYLCYHRHSIVMIWYTSAITDIALLWYGIPLLSQIYLCYDMVYLCYHRYIIVMIWYTSAITDISLLWYGIPLLSQIYHYQVAPSDMKLN